MLKMVKTASNVIWIVLVIKQIHYVFSGLLGYSECPCPVIKGSINHIKKASMVALSQKTAFIPELQTILQANAP